MVRIARCTGRRRGTGAHGRPGWGASAAAVAVAVLAAACYDAAAPGAALPAVTAADLVGTYALQSIDGHPLPWVDTSSADPRSSGAIWYSVQQTFDISGRVTHVERYAYVIRDSLRQYVSTNTYYSWALAPTNVPAAAAGVVRLTYSFPGNPLTGAGGFIDYEYYRVEAGGHRLRPSRPDGPPLSDDTDLWER